MTSRTRRAVSLGVRPTRTPTFSSASFFACAVPEDPDTIAPAWPIVFPSGAVNPATYATTGLLTFCSMKTAARSSASPPISPIITIASVSGSAAKARRQSMCVVPITGSPPIPTHVEKPMSRSSYIIWYVSVPDLDTRPIRPSEVMSAGMMPALDLPGEATPGQFGPTMRVTLPFAVAYAQNSVESCTGIPSVITMTSGIPASIASITALLAPAGGTNTTETSAPVAAIVSATVPNTGTAVPPRSTVWPALRGLVPPTTVVPAASIRRPCLVPSDPVMPWIMIRLSPVRKIAISCSRRGLGAGSQLGGAAGGTVHGVVLLDHGEPRPVQDRPPGGGVVAVQPDHDRAVDLLAPFALFFPPPRFAPAPAQHAQRRHDAVRHLIAGGDAAEHVDQHAAHAGVGQHDFQAVGHHLGRGTAADVEEVRGPDAAEGLARLRDHVQGGHHQARAVADDPDLALELDEVEVLLPGPGLDRVRGTRVGEALVVLPEGRVVVEGDLPVQCDDPAVAGQDQRVHLDQCRVLVGEHRPQPLGGRGGA